MIRIPTLLACLTACLSVLAQAPLLTLDHADGAYAPGEVIRLTVRAAGVASVEYDVSYTPVAGTLASGSVEVRGGVAEVTYATDVPSFLYFRVRAGGHESTIAAAVGRDEIGALGEAPDDFDAFWARQRAALAEVPLDLERTLVTETEYTQTFTFSAAIVDGRRVRGYYVMPKNPEPKPASLFLPPYGSLPKTVNPAENPSERGNFISVSISIHDAPLDQQDPNAYRPDDLRDPETIFYRYAVLAAVRAMDVVATLPEWDRTHVVAYGRSQGGGLAMLTAAVDERVTHVFHSVSALAQHSGRLEGQAAGFPRYVKRAEDIYAAAGDDASYARAVEAIQYYDIVHAAARVDVPVMYFVNYLDEVCPPATHYAAFNAGSGPRVALHSLDLGHGSAPEFESLFLPFARLHIPSARTPPWPWPKTEQAFGIDAGEDRRLTSERVRLDGAASFDGQDLGAGAEVTWELASGPGTVTFDRPDALSTEASFSEGGTYRLRLRVKAPHPTDARKYYLLTDEVSVTTGLVGSIPVPATLTDFRASLTPQPTTITWETATEQGVRHFSVERSGDGLVWEAIAEVPSGGDASAPRHYRYHDASPPPGRSYYRLLTVDEDGAYDTSATVSVTLGGGGPLALAPNPATGTVCLTGAVPGERLRIVDQLGRVVRDRVLTEPCLDVGDLPVGLYVVAVGGETARLLVE